MVVQAKVDFEVIRVFFAVGFLPGRGRLFFLN